MKLLLDEPRRHLVLQVVEDAGGWETSRLSYIECGAAVARARRDGRVESKPFAEMLLMLDETWQGVTVVEVDDDIAHAAVAITRDHPVRASDAIHLASALAVAPTVGAITFACFDRRLWEAAGAFGMRRLPSSI